MGARNVLVCIRAPLISVKAVFLGHTVHEIILLFPVVVTDVIATLEIVNCQSVQVQILGTVSTVSIDKTDGCQVYLSKASLGAEIVTAKSSEMNVSIPVINAEDEGEFVSRLFHQLSPGYRCRPRILAH